MQNSLTKKLGLSVATMAMAATSLFTASDAQAVPAFARQTGMTCNSCHYQSFPALNGMGRSFKAGGFTMMGSQTLIENENMSLPSTLNASMAMKVLHAKGGKDKVGEIVWPDEVAMLVGGRANANAGWLMELGMAAPDAGMLSSKIIFNVAQMDSTTISIVPFSTDGLGPQYGMELMNTSAARNQRVIENRHALNPGQDMGIGTGEATGVSFVASDLATGWFANVSLWGPVWGGGIADPTGLANSIRLSYFFDLAGFDTGVGFLTRGGAVTTTADQVDTYTIPVGGQSIDFQMQGGPDFPLAVYFANATAGDTGDLGTPLDISDAQDGSETITFNPDGTSLLSHVVDGDETLTSGLVPGGASGNSLTLKYAVTPGILVHYASASLTAGPDSTAVTNSSVGVDLKPSENMTFMIFQETQKVGDADAHSALVMGWFIGL